MPRPIIQLEHYQELIGQLYLIEELTLSEVCQHLHDIQGIDVAKRTLQRRLKQWGMEKYDKTEDTIELRMRIVVLFYDTGLDDKSILQVLVREGFTVGLWTLLRIRKQLGMIRRLSPFQIEAQNGRIKELVQRELDRGVILPYCRAMLHQYFKMQGHIVSRYVYY